MRSGQSNHRLMSQSVSTQGQGSRTAKRSAGAPENQRNTRQARVTKERSGRLDRKGPEDEPNSASKETERAELRATELEKLLRQAREDLRREREQRAKLEVTHSRALRESAEQELEILNLEHKILNTVHAMSADIDNRMKIITDLRIALSEADRALREERDKLEK